MWEKFTKCVCGFPWFCFKSRLLLNSNEALKLSALSWIYCVPASSCASRIRNILNSISFIRQNYVSFLDFDISNCFFIRATWSTQRARKFKRVQAKKIVKSNKFFVKYSHTNIIALFFLLEQRENFNCFEIHMASE